MEKKDQINYRKMPVPSTPGAQQITNEGGEYKKGGSSLTHSMPTKYVVPGSDKKK